MNDNTSLSNQIRPEVICGSKKKKYKTKNDRIISRKYEIARLRTSEMGGKPTDRKVGIKRVEIKRE